MTNVHERTDNALDAVVARAVVNRQFRARLLSEPHAALREALGVPLPPNVTVRFIEKDPDVDAMLVLPDLVPEGGLLLPIAIAELDGPKCWVTCVTTDCGGTDDGGDIVI